MVPDNNTAAVARRAKDVGSAAVLLRLVLCAGGGAGALAARFGGP